jgi:serine/threonine-protein kinase
MSYLAMEFIDGVGLDRVIATAGRLPLERAASLAAQVADALDFAHKNNVVHRDIKPANIMIEAGDRVKVTDFGIAKVTDSSEPPHHDGQPPGHAVLHEPGAGAGRRPGRTQRPLRRGGRALRDAGGQEGLPRRLHHRPHLQDHHEEPPPIRELDPSLPDEIVRILSKSLAKTPEMRYQTAATWRRPASP